MIKYPLRFGSKALLDDQLASLSNLLINVNLESTLQLLQRSLVLTHNFIIFSDQVREQTFFRLVRWVKFGNEFSPLTLDLISHGDLDRLRP